MPNIEKVKTYVGFAVRSNKIFYGADAVLAIIHKVKVVLCQKEINRTSFSNLEKACLKEKVPMIITQEGEISQWTHKERCLCIGITEPNLASALINQYNIGGNRIE